MCQIYKKREIEFNSFFRYIFKMPIRQQQIDQLLMSSDEQVKQTILNLKKGKHQKSNEKKLKPIEDEYDSFFQSEVAAQKSITKKESYPSGIRKGISNKLQRKIINPVPNKQNKSFSRHQQEQYLNSQDFESQQNHSESILEKKSNHQMSPKAEQSQQQKSLNQQLVQEKENSRQNCVEESQLVQSQYTESRIKDEIQQNQMEEEISSLKQANSRMIGDDQMSQAQSEYIQSTRIDQARLLKKRQFKLKNQQSNHKKTNQKHLKNEKNEKKQSSSAKLPKKQHIKEKNSNKIQALPLSKPVSTKPIQDKQTNLSKTHKNIKQVSNVKKQQQLKLTQSQQQHKLRLAQIQAEKKLIQQKKNTKIKEQKQKALKQYEEMKKKDQQKKILNKKILEEQKSKKRSLEQANTNLKSGNKILLPSQKDGLKLNDSKIKQQALLLQKKKNEKAKMVTAIQIKQKRRLQEQQTKSKLQRENRQKLKRLKEQKQNYFDRTQNTKKQYQQKRQQALIEKKQLKQNFFEEKKNEKKQQQIPEVRKLKQEIQQIREKIKQKQQSIQSLDPIINQLKKTLKKNELIKYNHGQQESPGNSQSDRNKNLNLDMMGLDENEFESQLTSVEKFVTLFEGKSTGEIFQMIDENGDRVVSVEEIIEKVSQILASNNQSMQENQHLSLTKQQLKISFKQNSNLNNLIQEIFSLLDKNSDGNVTQQQFSFILDSQIKKAHEYRTLIQNLPFKNPIDIEANILDMKEKIKYIQKKSLQELANQKMLELQSKYQKYLKKHNDLQKKLTSGRDKKQKNNHQNDQLHLQNIQEDLKNEKLYFLRHEAVKLRLEKHNQESLLSKMQHKQQQNIKQKNLELCQKVEQNIKLNEQIYKIKTQIDEEQLRLLSKQKIQQNCHRYVEKKSEQQSLYAEAIQRAKQYQTKILNPTKQIKFTTYGNQVKYLAAVIMIQRNFRKRKAMRQIQNLQKNI